MRYHIDVFTSLIRVRIVSDASYSSDGGLLAWCLVVYLWQGVNTISGGHGAICNGGHSAVFVFIGLGWVIVVVRVDDDLERCNGMELHSFILH